MTPTSVALFSVSVISTHTLTWSVTDDGTHQKTIITISTHTLTWSVTADTIVAFFFRPISTHTLTWSVTWPNL